ncbi:MAG: glycosyltransferase family 2 protein, partial [Planctomycetota bacterium]
MAESQEPLVSVVLPIYNGERFLREALRNVLKQSGFDRLEVVAIDDGSTDGSAAIVESL